MTRAATPSDDRAGAIGEAAMTPAARSAPSAKSILTTMLGEFVLPAGGTVWTSTVIDGLATLGIDERNTRQAMARLGDDGIVESERRGRRARWRLTAEGSALLRSGTERIYSFGDRSEAWDGRWTVIVCPIPESRRSARHQFRSQMAFAGFGFLTPTIAVSPHGDREVAANQILTALGEVDTAVTFRATTGTLTDDETLLAQAWDLDELEASYDEFVDEFEELAPTDRAESFASTVRLVDAWRRFPFLDPELPAGLLPDHWAGFRARRLFGGQRAAWRPDAERWFADTESGASGEAEPA